MSRPLLSLLALLALSAANPALGQTKPLHSLGEAELAARARGYDNVGNLERRGRSIWATATDRQGNRVRLRFDQRTGSLSGVTVVDAASPSRSPLPSVVPPALPVPPPGVEPKSYYIPPVQPPALPNAPRLGLPGPSWCAGTPNGPGC